ncbi:MAG TPA: hypothetical protein VFK05_35425 [Polyangiaceae bacterium]|nr:hypothetical protein [Polyangiaceae bacterium]
MRARIVHWLPLLAFPFTLAACVDTTDDQVVDFEAVASGPADAAFGEPLSFQGSQGWAITLTRARLHIGALYLAETLPPSGAEDSCILPGNYLAQVVQGRDIDLLSSERQAFPSKGHGSSLEARAAQVWLTGDDVNLADAPMPPTVILQVQGSAQRAGELRPFTAELTIANNRVSSDGGAVLDSAICNQRIVSPIPTSIRVHGAGTLWLRVDPRLLFANVDFAALSLEGDVFVFKDDASDEPSRTLYENLTQPGPLYAFSWLDEQR